jgi:D-3-phosphoglycerate dehydrogenase
VPDTESSPEFLEKHSDIDDLLQFKSFNTQQEQDTWVAEQIELNIKSEELRPDDIIVINPDPLTTRLLVPPIRSLLYEKGIKSHTAGIDTSPDVFFSSENDSVAFTGIDHIDKNACIEKGMKVSNAAGYSTDSVAELVIGLIISKLRNIVECNTVIRQGKTKDGLVGSELTGKTVGIIGTGAIGRRTAKLLKAFDCNLLGYNRHHLKEAEELGIQYVGLDELLKQSDIITLHVPLTEETKFLIDENKLKLLKPDALLINCARGEVIDIKATAEALKEKKIAGAAIDVFEIEPPLPLDHVLMDVDNAILTPHVAFATKESMVKRANITFDNIYSWLEGKQINTML